MEGAPYFPESNEAPSIETPEKKKEEKKKKGFEALLPEKRQKEAEKIAESLDKSPLFGEQKPEKPELKHLEEPEAAPETEAPLENLGEEEQREIVQELAANRIAEVEAEAAAAEPDSPEAIEAAAVIEELEKIEASGEIDVEADLETEEAEEEPAPVIEAAPLEEGAEVFLAAETPEETEDTTTPPTMAAAPPAVPPAPPVRPPLGGAPVPPSVPRPRTPDMIPVADALYYERQAQNRGLLVGGILGYLIGRRRGRIKTEKRLLPVQKRLEKQVNILQKRLQEREMAVRQHAAETAPQKPRGIEHKPMDRTAVEKPRPAESRLELEKPKRIERLGKAVVQAEAPLPIAESLRNIPAERVKAMNRSELLLVSEKIVVEGASLRQIYESHLIGERGLRHLVSEHLRGKDIRRELRRELVEREIDFERDPLLRDAAMASGAEAGGSASLQQLLEKAGVMPASDEEVLKTAKLRAQKEEEAMQRERRRRLMLDTAMVTLITVLTVAVIILLFRDK